MHIAISAVNMLFILIVDIRGIRCSNPQLFRQSGIYMEPSKEVHSHMGYIGIPIMIPVLDRLPTFDQALTCWKNFKIPNATAGRFTPNGGYEYMKNIYEGHIKELKERIPSMNASHLLKTVPKEYSPGSWDNVNSILAPKREKRFLPVIALGAATVAAVSSAIAGGMVMRQYQKQIGNSNVRWLFRTL